MKKVAIFALTVLVMSGSVLSAQSYGNSYPSGGSSNPISYPSSSPQNPNNQMQQARIDDRINVSQPGNPSPVGKPTYNSPSSQSAPSTNPQPSSVTPEGTQVYSQWSNGPFYADGSTMSPNIPVQQQQHNANASANSIRTDANNVNAAISNEAVTTRVRTVLKNDTALSNSAKAIQVSVNEGKVTLSGVVVSDAEKNKVESMIRQVNGVKTVINRLVVSSSTSR